MNRKNLTAAVLAGLAGAAGVASTAQAVNVNPDGLGDVLIYPYYTANDGNQTILSVVNTTENAKAVKVRFLEGFNSREVLDFNLYMSPYDVWVASISRSSEDAPGILIPDASCTVPYLYDAEMGYGWQDFLDYAYTGDFEDGGPTTIERSAEGHFEMIEMGTLTSHTAALVEHVQIGDELCESEPDEEGDTELETCEEGDPEVGKPLDCGALVSAWTQYFPPNPDHPEGDWFEDALSKDDCQVNPDLDDFATIGCKTDIALDDTVEGGGLFGGAAVVNAENGTMYSYDAVAIQGTNDFAEITESGLNVNTKGNHYLPGLVFPSLNSGNQTTANVAVGGLPQYNAYSFSNPVDAVSATLMTQNIYNEYSNNADLNAGTEWIITFPTKNFYTDLASMDQGKIVYTDNGETGCDPNADPDDDDYEDCTYNARPPFTTLSYQTDACEIVEIQTWDREEATFSPDQPTGSRPPVVSPAPPQGCDPEVEICERVYFELCSEVNVLRFGEESVFGTPDFEGSSLLYTVENQYTEGWADLNLRSYFSYDFGDGQDEFYRFIGDEAAISRGLLTGLPVAGFAAYEFENGTLEGGSIKANYGGLFKHKGVKALVTSTTPD
jgi:hypothetical protein